MSNPDPLPDPPADILAAPAHAKELMSVFIARQMRNGDYVALGTNLPVSTAGVLLAHLTRCPDIKISALSYFMNLARVERFHDLGQVASPRLSRWAESVWSLDALLDAVPRMEWSFTGALQIDKFGNTNLIGIGDDPRNLTFRGPGSVGSSTVAALVRHYMIHVGNHTPRVLVEKCDYRSAFGFGDGGDHRQRLGLPGGGPKYVVTPKAIMDFEPESKHMRLKHLLPGVTIDEVLANTGFQLLIPDTLDDAPLPTPEELRILRTRIDTQGVLRT